MHGHASLKEREEGIVVIHFSSEPRLLLVKMCGDDAL